MDESGTPPGRGSVCFTQRRGWRDFYRQLLHARPFPPSSLCLLQLLLPGLYLMAGGSGELALWLTLLCVFNCLYLTLLEFAGVLVLGTLAFMAFHGGLHAGEPAVSGLLVFNALLLLGRYRVVREVMLLSEQNRSLTRMAMIDKVTGAYNRRYLYQAGQGNLQLFIRKDIPFSVVLLDVDHFKAINDTHGHRAGDEVLRRLSGLLEEALRGQDIFGRYGGDEFLIILPGTPLDEARQAAERFHGLITDTTRAGAYGSRPIRVSLGVAQVKMTDTDFSDVVQHADEALYRAKREGRNTIRAWHDELREPVRCRTFQLKV